MSGRWTLIGSSEVTGVADAVFMSEFCASVLRLVPPLSLGRLGFWRDSYKVSKWKCLAVEESCNWPGTAKVRYLRISHPFPLQEPEVLNAHIRPRSFRCPMRYNCKESYLWDFEAAVMVSVIGF